MQPRGLSGLALDTLTASTTELRSIFSLLAARESYPVLVHCTQGKDRTGLVILLLLLLTGEKVPLAAVKEDYMRSEGELESEIEERMKEIRALGLGEEFGRCDGGFVEVTCGFLGERFGGVEGYLGSIGVGGDLVENIRQSLLV